MTTVWATGAVLYLLGGIGLLAFGLTLLSSVPVAYEPGAFGLLCFFAGAVLMALTHIQEGLVKTQETLERIEINSGRRD